MAVAPAPGTTSGSTDYAALLGAHSEFRVAQTMKGCFQEMMGCEANSEFHFIAGGAQIGIIEEQSSCCMRFCCGGNRPWDTKMAAGKDINEAAVLTFSRPFRCPKGPNKCCCFQEVAVAAGPKVEEGGTDLGKAIEGCYCFIPGYKTLKPDGSHEYDFHQPTCCGGMCVNLFAQGCCSCRIPFYVYPPLGSEEQTLLSTGSTPVPGMESETPKAQICKIWGGVAQELFSDADTFEVKTPDGADPASKARLIAATLMINQLHFETDKDDKSADVGIGLVG